MTRPPSTRKPLKLVSLRFKLLSSFTILFVAVFSGVYYWFYQFSIQKTMEHLQEDLTQTLNGAVQGIDGDAFIALKQAKPRPDGYSDDARYWQHVQWLATVSAINPKAFVYTYTAAPDSNTIIFIGSDTAVNHRINGAKFLERYKITAKEDEILLKGLKTQTVDLSFGADKWGFWATGVQPIFNSKGEDVGALGIDYKADYILSIQRGIRDRILVAFITTYSILFVLIYFLSGVLTKQLNQLAMAAKKTGDGDYQQDFSVIKSFYLPDEFDLLARVFQGMVDRIQMREQLLKNSETHLEQQVQEHTYQLEQSLNFADLLQRITDRVRDSLDERHILQSTVQELTNELQIVGCNTAIFDLRARKTTIQHQCFLVESPVRLGQSYGIDGVEEFAEVHAQLLKGETVQFCVHPMLAPEFTHQQGYTILACPIEDDQGILGDIWLFRESETWFEKREVRLAQQVANHCAIAIRQARLYQATQERLAEMETLNLLKDDFLSTVSHELRSPVANMKMAIQMLQINLNKVLSTGMPPDSPYCSRLSQYVHVLDSECEREISLVNDLLDLQRLDAGIEPSLMDLVNLKDWLPDLVQSFKERASTRDQQLTLAMESHFPALQTDAAALKRILAELLHNACKYTPPGEKICVTANLRQDKIMIEVMNSGSEIPEKELTRIFEKFYRIPNADPWKQGGTGLGLALVKRLVEHLNGIIQVESATMQTRFILQFPVLSFCPFPQVSKVAI